MRRSRLERCEKVLLLRPLVNTGRRLTVYEVSNNTHVVNISGSHAEDKLKYSALPAEEQRTA